MNELKELDELLMYALTFHRRPPLRLQEETAWYRVHPRFVRLKRKKPH